jgi:hypothetical protein
MTTLMTAMWIHGNAVVPEHLEHLQVQDRGELGPEDKEYPEPLLALDRRGWGTEFKLQRGTSSWFHIAIPTPIILNDHRSQLVRVFLFFNTPREDGQISAIHLYDGANRFQVFENLSLTGDCRRVMSGYNALVLPHPQSLYSGLGLSFLYQAWPCSEEPYSPSYLSIATAGADFLMQPLSFEQSEESAPALS